MGIIYFITMDGEPRFVKIGYTSSKETLPERLSSLQVGNPFRLKMHGVKEGKRFDEIALHRRFSDQNNCGEWFLINDEIKRIMDTECGSVVLGKRKYKGQEKIVSTRLKKDVSVTIRLPSEVKKRILDLANERCESISDLILGFLEEYQ
jgi:hypothetical protein